MRPKWWVGSDMLICKYTVFSLHVLIIKWITNFFSHENEPILLDFELFIGFRILTFFSVNKKPPCMLRCTCWWYFLVTKKGEQWESDDLRISLIDHDEWMYCSLTHVNSYYLLLIFVESFLPERCFISSL